MGNCLNTMSSHDDISLLRDTAPPGQRESSDQLSMTASGISSSQTSQAQTHFVSLDSRSGPTANQMSEEEQVKLAQRMGLIQHLPTGSYDGCKKNRECVICMIEFLMNDPIRFLPCMHIYHTKCIDDWLIRSFTCPSCMEPVDAALLSTYQTD